MLNHRKSEPPPKRTCVRYSREQKSVLDREFAKGTARLSNADIAMEMIPDGLGRKVAACLVQNWMSARARRLRIVLLSESLAARKGLPSPLRGGLVQVLKSGAGEV
jgi:hypothetical protein